MAVRAVYICVYTLTSKYISVVLVCVYITCVYLFLKDMDVGSWLPADGFIQVEYKH